MNISNSINAFRQAKKCIPGGVNSPVRAFRSVNSDPIFISRAKGSKIYDIDGNEYIDFVASWGPLILGHAHESIINAVKKASGEGTSYGAPTLLETEVAEMITSMVPSIEKVRMVNSGTEATMSAIRLARGFTGRENIVKFAGCFHGHGDSFLIKAGSGAMTLGLPDSPGVTSNTAQNTITAEYNDLEGVEQIFREKGDTIACIIVEPVPGNMGVILPDPGFLEGLRAITGKYGALLIFDEVITGFRLGKGGAQERLGVLPDLTTLGKIIGGGLPVGAYGGKAEIMNHLAPEGPVYQAGTLSGNPLAMAAGKAMLTALKQPEIYYQLEEKAGKTEAIIRENLQKTGVKALLNRIGSMMALFFTSKDKIMNYSDSISTDSRMYARYFNYCLQKGIYLAPSAFESMFISTAHDDNDLEIFAKINLAALKYIQ